MVKILWDLQNSEYYDRFFFKKKYIRFFEYISIFQKYIRRHIFLNFWIFFSIFYHFLTFRTRHEPHLYASDWNNFSTDRKLRLSAFGRYHSRLVTRSKNEVPGRFEISDFLGIKTLVVFSRIF